MSCRLDADSGRPGARTIRLLRVWRSPPSHGKRGLNGGKSRRAPARAHCPSPCPPASWIRKEFGRPGLACDIIRQPDHRPDRGRHAPAGARRRGQEKAQSDVPGRTVRHLRTRTASGPMMPGLLHCGLHDSPGLLRAVEVPAGPDPGEPPVPSGSRGGQVVPAHDHGITSRHRFRASRCGIGSGYHVSETDPTPSGALKIPAAPAVAPEARRPLPVSGSWSRAALTGDGPLHTVLPGQTAGWPPARVVGGKSGLHGNTVPGNARRGRPQGKCHRKQTACPPAGDRRARVKGCGKSAPRRRRRRRLGKPHREQDRVGMTRRPRREAGRRVSASSSG